MNRSQHTDHFKIDSDSEDDGSDSDIHSGPRKRRRYTASNQGKCCSNTLDIRPMRRRFLHRHTNVWLFPVASKRPTPSTKSLSDSGSEEQAYNGSRPRIVPAKKNRQQRRMLQAAAEPSSNHGEVRFSTRKAAKVSNYNEDDEDPFEDEDNILTPGYWATAQDEDVPAIDAVLNHRLREDRSREITTLGKDDFEYKIKWQGKAHIHATWETNGALISYRGIRRLDNYYKKTVEEDIHMTHDSGIPPEEKEKWSLDRERDADALDDYVKVERVIGKQLNEDGEVEYFVKCMAPFFPHPR